LSTFFVWAMQMGLCENNPTIGVIRPATNGARERVLSDAELAAIWKACDDGTEYSKVVRLLILTGCRRAEIGDMRWSEIDLDRATFTIPASRSKNKRPHTLPLMPMMREIVDTVSRMATRDQLFGAHAAGFTNWTLPKPDLDRRSGVSSPAWTLHDVRRSVATGLANLGVLPHTIEAALNHQSGSKRRRWHLQSFAI
jgi:integrase